MWFTDITKHVLTIGDSLRAENSWLYTLERSGSLVLTAAGSITVVEILVVLHVERRQDEGPDIVLLLKFISSDVIELTYSRLICLDELVLFLQRDKDVVSDAILSKVDRAVLNLLDYLVLKV